MFPCSCQVKLTKTTKTRKMSQYTKCDSGTSPELTQTTYMKNKTTNQRHASVRMHVLDNRKLVMNVILKVCKKFDWFPLEIPRFTKKT